MSIRTLWRKVQYQPEFSSAILFFSLMMLQPIQEQFLYKVYSKKVGIEYNFKGSGDGTCTKGNTTNHTLLMQEVFFNFLYNNCEAKNRCLSRISISPHL